MKLPVHIDLIHVAATGCALPGRRQRRSDRPFLNHPTPKEDPMSIATVRRGPLPRFSGAPTEPKIMRQAAGIQEPLIALVRGHGAAVKELAANPDLTPKGKVSRHEAIVANTFTKLRAIAQSFREQLVEPHNRLTEELRSVVTTRQGPAKARSELQLFTQKVESLEATIREDRILKRFEKLDKLERVKVLQDAAEREDREMLEAILLAPQIGEDLVPQPRVRREAQLALAKLKAPAHVDQLEALHEVVVPLKAQLRDVARGLPRELELDGLPCVRAWRAAVDADEERDTAVALDHELFPRIEAPTVPTIEAE
ncbi:MAG: hypothetical protein ACYTDU_21070 [Planctomycetota bacterium]